VTAVFVTCAVMLTAAIVLVLRRVEIGPSVLDRVVALDVVVSTFLAGIAVYAAWTDRRDLVAVMIVLSLVGFVGAVSVARFVAAESDEERRILSAEEISVVQPRSARRPRRTRSASPGPSGRGNEPHVGGVGEA
jgi:multicomponent Na+:H+ antiporter subunit F